MAIRVFLKKTEQIFGIQALLRLIDEIIVSFNTRHIYGPRSVALNEDDVIVTCLVKDGEFYIKSFMEHYTSLGVKHFVFMDNGSTDNTLRAIREAGASAMVIQCTLPFARYKDSMRRHLVKCFARKRWSINVDIDELFDYPYSDKVSLRDLVQYCRANSVNAVVTQMLDMFSDGSVDAPIVTNNGSLKDLYRYYDLSAIDKQDYLIRHNTLENTDIKIYIGGIRKLVFDANCLLTKHSLIYYEFPMKLYRSAQHLIKNARLADFTAVVLHYKFTSDFRKKVGEAIREENYYNKSSEYKLYSKRLESGNLICLMQGTSRKLKDLNELIDIEFLTVSEKFSRFASGLSKGE